MVVVTVGPFEVVGGGVLAVLAMIVLFSFTVLALWVVACTVVAPAMAVASASLEHRRRREWRRRVRDSWLTEPGETPPASEPEQASPVRRVGHLCSPGDGVDVRIVAAELTPGRSPSTVDSMTLLHAQVRPGGRLDLPPQQSSRLVVYVLAGRGSLGREERPVRSGQVALLPTGTPVALAAATDSTAPLEVLVLDGPVETSSDRALAAGDTVLTAIDPTTLHRLRSLRQLTDDLPTTALPIQRRRHARPRVEPAPAA